MGETILTDGDIAEILAGRDTFDEETVVRLARYMSSDPGLEPQRAKMRALALEAGLDPETSPEAFDLARSLAQDFEALLARDDWDDPLEVLDQGKPVWEARPNGYEELLRIASARARRAKDPAPILVVMKKLESAHARLLRCARRRDAFLASLAEFEEEIAESLFNEALFRFRRRRQELKAAQQTQRQKTAEQVEQQLDQLVAANRWAHPVQVLERPRADLAALLRACHLRRIGAEGEGRRLLEVVEEKLERAVRIAEAARQRRKKVRRGV